MARSLRQLSPALLLPLRGCKRLHNLDATRCFQGSSLIKNVTHRVSGGLLSKGGNGRCSSWDNGLRHQLKLPQLFLCNFSELWWCHVLLPTCVQLIKPEGRGTETYTVPWKQKQCRLIWMTNNRIIFKTKLAQTYLLYFIKKRRFFAAFVVFCTIWNHYLT